ncbi:MAG: dihydrofolate reductase family protein [Candidatus Dormiibacterota bacterium]
MARKLIYSMMVSLDGYIEPPEPDLEWGIVDEPIHRFAGDQVAELGAALYGRKLYEVMSYWDTAEEQPDLPDYIRDFARTYTSTPKVVFSTTLDSVGPNSRLVREGAVEEVRRLKSEDGGPLGIAGANLASTMIREGLVDEYRPIVHPVVLGGGKPFFPPSVPIRELKLLETKTFPAGHVYLRYQA